MKVYRVQDNDGRGPWKPGFSMQWVEDRTDLYNLPPWFVEFGDVQKKAIIGMTMGSGCLSISQLRRWFTPIEYFRLLDYGYHAVVIEVDILARSEVQCFFQRAKALNEDIEFIELYSNEELNQSKKTSYERFYHNTRFKSY